MFDREFPSGGSEGVPSGMPVTRVFGSRSGRASASHFRIGFPIRTPCFRENPRTGPGGCPDGVGSGSSEPGRPVIRFFGTGEHGFGSSEPALSRVWKFWSVWRGSGSSSSVSQCTRGQGSGNRFRFRPVEQTSKRRKAHESIGCGRPRFAAVRISAESNALELRGIVTSWSSEQEHAMSETA